MKRIILFIVGAMLVLPLCADNYALQSDGTYSYTGEPVSELSVDFTTWWGSYLPSTLSDDMALAEKNNLGFVKWKIKQRTCGDKGQVYALFNDDYNDFSAGGSAVRNNSTTNPPRIFLPTTARGVKSIKISGYVGGGNSQSVGVYYKDASQSTWKWKGSLTLTTTYGEVSLDLNTEGQTSIYLNYDKTAWCTISDLELDIEEEEEPVFQYNSENGQYDYIGVPVDELNVDFTTWKLTDLPSSFTDDMVLAQKNGIGFVKWRIASRPCGEKGTVHALFNNNNGDAGVTEPNTTTTNKPRIFLPTTARGVKKIKVFGGANGQPLGIYYKDANQSSWKWKASLILPAEFGEVTVDLNTTGMTSLYLTYDRTVWPAITNIELEIEDPLYVLNTETGVYEYQGDPVDAVNIDFSTWKYADLPGSLREDYPLIEAHDCGFIKWKLPWYNPGGSFTAQRVLCNDNTNDAGVTEPNNTTANKPAIYFPTTTRGIESVAIKYVSGTSSFWLNYSYTDGLGTTSQSAQLPASQANDPQTFVLNLNTAGPTSLHFMYAMTVWVRILNIEFTIKDSESTPLGLWDYTNSTGNMSKLTEANGQTRDVYFKRSFVADGGYYTLCLPFDLSAAQVNAAFGTCTLKKLATSELQGTVINLNFVDADHIEAGVPYLFMPTADIQESVFSGVTIDTDAPTTVQTDYFSMTGIYNPTSLTSEDYFLGADNYLTPASNDNPLRPFRAYFTIENPSQQNVPARVVFVSEQATGSDNVQCTKDNVRCTKVMKNGVLYLMYNGTMYNVQGQMVR